jgi:hypothetical protein
MKKTGLFLSIILLLAFTACNQSSKENMNVKPQKTDDLKPKTIELRIEKVDDVWKVINVTDSSGNAPVVRKNDKINWTAEGTDVYIQFPDTMFSPVGPADSLKHGYMKHQPKDKKLKLKLKDVKAGTYIYAVFCTEDSTFAQEDSPPKIIVLD